MAATRRYPPCLTLTLAPSVGRDGDAQVMLKARDTRGHLVDPVGGLQKLMEKADSGVHQRHTWTKGAFSANPCNLGTI